MTYISLRCELPTLEPDDAFVRQLAELAAASRTSPAYGVAAFGGATGRSLAAAAAVAAIAAGAAAAAGQMNHSHPLPSPPITTRGTDAPQSPESTAGQAAHRGDGHQGRQLGAGDPAQPIAASTDGSFPAGDSTSDTSTGGHHSGPGPGTPGQHDPGDGDDPSTAPTSDLSDDPHEGPGDGSSDPSDGSSDSATDGGATSGDGGGDGGTDGSSDGGSDGSSSGPDGGGLTEVAD